MTSVRRQARSLATGVAIYGAADAALTVVNFLLLPVYVRTLSPTDYGALLILISLETFIKIINRWGLDGAFMRYYPDRADGRPRQQLTSTLGIFLLVVDGVLLALALAASSPLALALFEDGQYIVPLRLMLLNTFVMAFTFVPFHVMRIRQQSVQYAALNLARSAGTTVLRLVLVVGANLGLTGMYGADLIVTLLLLPALWPWTRPLLAPTFSWQELRQLLRFGLPRLPHGLAQQAFDYGNRLMLTRYVPLAEAGVYQNGATLSSVVKFFLASFETAWAPFYYATSRQDDAKAVFSKMTTYGVAVLVLLAAITIAVAEDAVLLLLEPEWLEAARVMPFIAVGLACQGVYLLTSIGLNLMNRTTYYPVATFAALGVGLGSGAWLMPAYGLVGAAISFMLSFVVQAAVAFLLSRSVYPIAYEGHRLARLVVAGTIATLVGRWAVPDFPPLAGVVARAVAVTGTYGVLLWASGFLRASERRFLAETIRKRGL